MELMLRRSWIEEPVMQVEFGFRLSPESSKGQPWDVRFEDSGDMQKLAPRCLVPASGKWSTAPLFM
jgi:hypothetical protein